MQHAMKLALVDPRHLEYKDLGKDPGRAAKADASLEMRNILYDPNLPDDLKIKLYRNTMDRFMRVTDTIEPEQPLPPINYVEETKTKTKRKKNKKSPVKQPQARRTNRQRKPKVRWEPL